MDIEELRTQLAAERLAREQGDDRCMENARDMVIEETAGDWIENAEKQSCTCQILSDVTMM